MDSIRHDVIHDRTPTAPPPLADDVHVWRASLDVPEERVRALWELLADDERARAERFTFDRDRNRWIVAHGLLRTLLGGYSGDDAAALRFEYGPHGKPQLQGTSALQFNLSHSHEVALYAIARRRVGVDAEWLRPIGGTMATARRFLSPPELAALLATPAARRDEAFLCCWVRKEAYVKARGDGLSLDTTSFTVSLPPDAAAVRTEAERWQLADVPMGTGWVGAVAVERDERAPHADAAIAHFVVG